MAVTPVRFLRYAALAIGWFAKSSLKMLRRARRGDAPDPNLLHLYAQELARGWSRFLGLDVTIRHKERLTDFQPCVYIANHRSNLDIPTLAGVLPQRTVVIAKKELLKVPFLGRMLIAGQNIVIDRQNHANAQAGIGQAERAIREDRISIWVFPEGHRDHGTLLPFKKGAFHLARNAEVTLVPIVHATSPRWVDARRLSVRKRTRVLVEILEPIDPSTFPSITACIQHAQTVVRETLSRLEEELAAD